MKRLAFTLFIIISSFANTAFGAMVAAPTNATVGATSSALDSLDIRAGFSISKEAQEALVAKHGSSTQVPTCMDIAFPTIVTNLESHGINLPYEWAKIVETITPEVSQYSWQTKQLPTNFVTFVEKLGSDVKMLFTKEASEIENPWLIDKVFSFLFGNRQFFSADINIFIENARKSHQAIIVRSTHNKSIGIEGVPPTTPAILRAMGKVIEAQCTKESLQKRLGSGDTTIFQPPQFDITLQLTPCPNVFYYVAIGNDHNAGVMYNIVYRILEINHDNTIIIGNYDFYASPKTTENIALFQRAFKALSNRNEWVLLQDTKSKILVAIPTTLYNIFGPTRLGFNGEHLIRIKTIEDFIESTQTTQPTWTDALDTILLHNSTEARGRVLLSGHGGLFNLYRQYESATIASMLKHVYQELLSIFSTWNIEVMHIVSCFSAGNRESFHRDDLGNPIRYPFDIVTHGMLSQTLTGEAMAPLFEALKYFSIGTNFDTKQVVTTYINQLPHTIEKPTNAVAYLRPHDSDSFELLPSHGLGRLLTKSNESNAVEISTGKCPQQQKKTLFIITTPIIDCTLEIAGGSILSTVSGQTSHFIKELLITYQNSIDEKTLFLHVMLELFNNFFAIKYTDSPGISSLTDEQDFCTKGYLIQKLTATAADATITFEPIFLLKSKPYFSEYDELPFFIIIANVNHRWVKITIKIKSDNKKIDSITLKETSQTKALNSIRRLFCKMEPQQSDVDSDHRKELSDKIFTSLRATSNSANTTLPDSSDTRLIARFMHEITTASISPTGGKDPYMQLVSKIAVHIKPLKQL